MTPRDTFAAAALTGLLAAPTDKDRSMEYWARLAYEAADAMIRERERVTEPMPKEKRAEVAQQEPVCWAVFMNGEFATACDFKSSAIAVAGEMNGDVVPLYSQPTLTDEEREALIVAALELQALAMCETNHSDALRKLLARTRPDHMSKRAKND